MPRISIKDVEPGMELSEDVADRSGRVLLRTGATLEEKHIKVLKTWGITHIAVTGEEGGNSLQEIINARPELLQQATEMANTRFRLVNKQHPLFKALIESWTELYIKNKAAQDG